MNTQLHNVKKINIKINDVYDEIINVNDAVALKVYEDGMYNYTFSILIPIKIHTNIRTIRKLRKNLQCEALCIPVNESLPVTITIKELDGRVHNFKIKEGGWFIDGYYNLYQMRDIQMSFWDYLLDKREIFAMLLEIKNIELIDLGTTMPTGETKKPEPKPEPEVQLTEEQLKFLEQMNQNQPNLDF